MSCTLSLSNYDSKIDPNSGAYAYCISNVSKKFPLMNRIAFQFGAPYNRHATQHHQKLHSEGL